MRMIAFAIPILPGKMDAFRSAYRRVVLERHAEFVASRRRLGVAAERGFLQRTPAGNLAVNVFEVEEESRFFAGIAGSAEPLDVEFRAYLAEVFGLDVTRGPAGPPSEPVFDWQIDTGAIQ
jgi:hypothetical protein